MARLLKTRGQDRYEEVDEPGIYECETVVHLGEITITRGPEGGFAVRRNVNGFPALIHQEDPDGLVLSYDVHRAPVVLEEIRRLMVLEDIADA